ncbi:MAG TPA: glycosyltransferase family 39 protein, partial [Gemmatimonadales bacterium]|nr:glycosyltransferase family 39 protein [Gemmatimonadales bacterium]
PGSGREPGAARPVTDAGRRGLRIALGLLFAGAIALRVAAAGRELWLDETHSALLAGMSLHELIAFVKGDVHPPLYFLLLNAWRRIAGDSEAALRGFSILASAGAGAVFLAAAIRIFGLAWSAVLAGALFLLSPVMVHYGVEVRMYALVSVWMALIALGIPLLSSANPREARRGAVLVGAGAVLGFYTHYAVAFVLIGLLAFGVLEIARRRLPARPLVPAMVATALLCALWAPVLLQQRAAKAELRRVEMAARADPQSLSFGTDSNPARPLLGTGRALVENAASVAGVFPASRPVLLGVLALPLVAAVVVGGLGVGRLPWVRLFAGVALAMLAGGLVTGITARRFLLLAVPFLALALAEAISDLARRRARPALALGLAIGAIYLAGAVRTATIRSDRPTGAVVAWLAGHAKPGDLVVSEALYYQVLLEYHAKQRGVRLPVAGFPTGIREWWSSQPFKGWGGPPITRAALESFIDSLPGRAPSGRVWLIQFETRYYDPRRELLGALERSARVERVTAIPAQGGQDLYEVELAGAGQAKR